MNAPLNLPNLKNQVSAAEWQTRVDLAACYRLVALYGWSDLVFTHITARLPGPEHHFLINPYGLMFDEITASSLVKVDQDCNKLSDSPFPVNPAGFTIHSAIHAVREDAGCVLHTHSLVQTVASRLFAGPGHVRLEGYELLKAFEGQRTHETVLDLPLFDNDQDIARLAAKVQPWLDEHPDASAAELGEALGMSRVSARRYLEHLASTGRPGPVLVDISKDALVGPLLYAFSTEEPGAAGRLIKEFAKTNDRLEIVGGAMGDTALDPAGVKAVAQMPSREELIASIVACIGAPASNIAGAIGAPASNIAGILSTLEEREAA